MRCDLAAAGDAAPPPGAASEPSETLRLNLEQLTPRFLARDIEAAPAASVQVGSGQRGLPWISLGSRPLCSGADPVREARIWSRAQKEVSTDLIVVFGLGMGYHLEALRELSGQPIVVVEPSLEVLRASLSCRRLDLPGVTIVNTLKSLQDFLACSLRPQQSVVVMSWPPYLRILPTVSRGIEQVVERAGRLAHITNITLERRLGIWTQNLLRNVTGCAGRVPAWSLRERLTGLPVVLVSAGPSLDRNVEQLSRFRDRVVVVVVNTAVGALERAGVEADFIVALELLDVTSQFSSLRLNRESPKLLSMTSHPALFDLDGPILPFVDNQAFFLPFADRVGLGPGIPAGGSVSNTAMALITVMNASSIILTGQDLAYRGDRLYAAGTVFDEMRVKVSGGVSQLEGLAAKRLIGASVPEADETYTQLPAEEVEGWGGGTVWTNPQFNYFRYSFERWARALTDVTLINATEGGARIGGFDERRLADVLGRLPAISPPALPTEPTLDAGTIRAALADELTAARAAEQAAEQAARAVARNDSGPALKAMRDAIMNSGLVYAMAWPALQSVDQDSEMTFAGLCEQLAGNARETAGYIEEALGRF